MASDNAKYHNTVKKLSAMQEKYRKQKKNVLLVRTQLGSSVVQGMIGRIYTTVLMLKPIHWKNAEF